MQSVATGLRFNPHKAGLDSVNEEEATRVIVDVSKGTEFYKNEERKEKLLEKRILEVTELAVTLSEQDKKRIEKFVDEQFISSWEQERDFSRTIVHLDMDAFFASVEELDQPSLKSLPMAVGSTSMLSTANYEARKYGVRSAMPGFIALKLCPQLVIVPPRFKRYCQVSNQIASLLYKFDSRAHMSMDEAYIDITEYLKTQGGVVEDVVSKIRQNIFENTGITCSAGVASNTMIAKIATDLNKPNGQTIVQPDMVCIQNFLNPLSVRKIPGVGRVTEKLLSSLNIFCIQDIISHRSVLFHCMRRKTFEFLLQSALGIAPAFICESESRKGMSRERTFKPTSSLEELRKICESVSKLLADDLEAEDMYAKTLTLKIKCSDFSVRTRAVTKCFFIYRYEQILENAWKLLLKEMPIEIRLLGVRANGLVSRSEILTERRNSLEEFISNMLKHRGNNSDDIYEEVKDFGTLSPAEPMHFIKNKQQDEKEPEVSSTGVCPICLNFRSSNYSLLERHVNFCIERQEQSLKKNPAHNGKLKKPRI
ncbi:DNA polymerase kappa [Galdieria sulphuraria]|uniref:DNA polymerase kappa n=1 Tax=Galdieria sulphuraria TaxID=130081 RepID=M2WQL0_GALSU|nr:DNA polymerase kappa subunit [Galdieria sulphuraria]EME26075.1 DNA polymerase kappa subunit [Galdieria sulphuraria]GJD11089.1 DNA polymerase kappa [Galdieria sulphuraria]|eukprot:XP_005702595.1 DNA polymerase kappa subunit [Galdieria sulphuraria]